MDADADGRKHANIVRQAFNLVARSDLLFRDHMPSGFKDRNDVLSFAVDNDSSVGRLTSISRNPGNPP
jgi:hypothetical protein